MVLAYLGMAHIVMACMAHIVMACIVMAAMAYTVVTYIYGHGLYRYGLY